MTRSEFVENLKVSFDTLRSHKVRSGLTLLGVVIGVTSVISVAAIIDGLNGYIQEKVDQFGPRTFFVARFPAGQDPNRMPERIRLRKYLEYDDARKVREAVKTIRTATAIGTRASFFGGTNEVRYGGNRVERIIVRGTEPEYVDAIPMFTVEYGRFLIYADVERSAQVAIIGADVADSLFLNSNPIGKMILLNGLQYEVIGVFARNPGLFGTPGVDQFVIIPLSTFRKHNPDMKEVVLAAIAPKEVPVQVAMDDVAEALRRIRRVPPQAENDFEIISSDFLSSLWNQLTGAIVVLTGVISSIGLLVGGIGVMNIMLISVTERTKEIGVRKAIGARASDIRVQFLLEAVTLTTAGGIIGIILGVLIAALIRAVAPSIPAAVSPFWVFMGFTISAAVGLFFGYYPANRAATLDPIVCLRYE